jgi:hypothetical protein
VGWIREGGGIGPAASKATITLPGYAGWQVHSGEYIAWVSFNGLAETRRYLFGSGEAKYVLVSPNRRTTVSLGCTGQLWYIIRNGVRDAGLQPALT